MKVLVIGAGGASGRAALHAFHERGHEVTAMMRGGARPNAALPFGVKPCIGDATDIDDVRRAVRGQDMVVVTLGIRENPVKVRLFGAGATHAHIRSIGTANVVQAMRELGPRRLIAQSTYGIGATQGKLDAKWRCIFALLLRPQIDDHMRQEHIVRHSDLDWTLLQPVGLSDDPSHPVHLELDDGPRLPSMRLSRSGLARVTVDVAEAGDRYALHSVAVSNAFRRQTEKPPSATR